MLHRTLDLPSGPIHALDFGGDGAPILLVHGLDGSAANWIDAAPKLTAGHRVLAIDLPGYGRTPLGRRSASLGAQAAVIGEVIEHELDGSAALVGNSAGGVGAMIAAADLGDAVDALVLVASAFPRAGTGPIAWSFVLPALTLWMPGVGRMTPRMRASMAPEQRVRALLDLCYGPHAGRAESTTAFREMVEVAADRDPDDHAAAWTATARSLWPLLARRGAFHRLADRVTAPVLVIDGDHDPIIPTTSVDHTCARHPHWGRVRLPVGHVPQLEDPETFSAVVRAFLNGCDAREALLTS